MTDGLELRFTLPFRIAAIMKAADVFCFLTNYIGPYYNLTGRVNDKDDSEANQLINAIKRYCGTWARGKRIPKARRGKEVFRFRPELCSGFIVDVAECAVRDIGIRDNEYVKYAIEHALKILL